MGSSGCVSPQIFYRSKLEYKFVRYTEGHKCLLA